MTKVVGLTLYAADIIIFRIINLNYMIYDKFVTCNWVDNRWQFYITHLHTNNTQNNTMKQNT